MTPIVPIQSHSVTLKITPAFLRPLSTSVWWYLGLLSFDYSFTVFKLPTGDFPH